MGLLTLVRHGQASFGTHDYDRLSSLGHEQAAALGTHLRGAGRTPDLLLVGGMRRQRETCGSLAAAAGWEAVPVRTDAAWDEYDHEAIVAGVPGPPTAGPETDSRSFQHRLEEGLARWTQDPGDDGRFGPESWEQFRDRTDAGLARAVAEAGPGRWVVVVSSAGPVSLACARLALPPAPGDGGGDGEAAMRLWPALNRVLVNSAQSRVVVGRSGVTLLSFNEHQHLSPGLVTSR